LKTAQQIPKVYSSGCRPNRSMLFETFLEKFEGYVQQLHRWYNCGDVYNKDFLVKAYTDFPLWVESFYPSFDWRHLSLEYTEAMFLFCNVAKSNGSSYFGGLSHDTFSGVIRDTSQSPPNINQKLSMNQSTQHRVNSIKILPVQMGARYASSPFRNIKNNFLPGEIGLSTFEALQIFLLDLHRLRSDEDYSLVCMRDRFVNGQDTGPFAPTLFFHDHSIRLGIQNINRQSTFCSAPTIYIEKI